MDQILIERPAPGKLEVLAVSSWPVQTLQTGEHQRQHTLAQECFLFDGELRLSLHGQDTQILTAGDLFIIPENSTVVWRVITPLEYGYHDLEPVDIG